MENEFKVIKGSNISAGADFSPRKLCPLASAQERLWRINELKILLERSSPPPSPAVVTQSCQLEEKKTDEAA